MSTIKRCDRVTAPGWSASDVREPSRCCDSPCAGRDRDLSGSLLIKRGRLPRWRLGGPAGVVPERGRWATDGWSGHADGRGRVLVPEALLLSPRAPRRSLRCGTALHGGPATAVGRRRKSFGRSRAGVRRVAGSAALDRGWLRDGWSASDLVRRKFERECSSREHLGVSRLFEVERGRDAGPQLAARRVISAAAESPGVHA